MLPRRTSYGNRDCGWDENESGYSRSPNLGPAHTISA